MIVNRLIMRSGRPTGFHHRWIGLCILLNVLVLVALPVGAQQSKKIPRIGWLSGGDSNSSRSQLEGFRRGYVSWVILRDKAS